MLSRENERTLKGLLHARRQALEAAIEAARPVDDIDGVVDRKDLAGHSQAGDDAATQTDRALAELGRVHAAQARLLDGTYGVCTDCGASIDLRRLMLEPAASRCVPCAEHIAWRPFARHTNGV